MQAGPAAMICNVEVLPNFLHCTCNEERRLAEASRQRYSGRLQRVEVVLLRGEEAVLEGYVRSSDVLCLCTNASQPLFDGAWLQPGTHVNGVGSYTPQMQEMDARAKPFHHAGQIIVWTGAKRPGAQGDAIGR